MGPSRPSSEFRTAHDGVVHQMSVHTVGGSVEQSEPAMLIVPDGGRLTVEVHAPAQDIHSARPSQKAMLRLTAFNARTTPEVDGVVTRVSADVTTDPKTGQSYYTARIGLPGDELARLSAVRLQPGMPVEAHLQIGERTVLSYLTKPLVDQIAKAWRER